jgi:tRNA threonylcarbamoyladenosine biosynthesis protein TsaB
VTTGAGPLLLLETSGRAGFVALAAGDELLVVRRLDEPRRLARDLAPAVKELLAGQGWMPADLAAVFVGRGPGSYTGLRVGLMSAKALAYATGCALLAVDTFAVLAAQAPDEVPAADVLADAQQDKVYVQRYARAAPGEPFRPATELAIRPFAAWLAGREPNAWVTGPGLRVRGRTLPEGVSVVAEESWDPRPESLLEVGLARYRAGERDDQWAVEPLYLRPSAAEEQWQRKAP